MSVIVLIDKMQLHPDEPKNPLYEDLKDLLDYERGYACDFRRGGKLKTMDISEANEQLLKETVLDVQTTCLPTLNAFRNERNVSQLQERVQHKWQPYIDRLNLCIMRSRTAMQIDYCFVKYKEEYDQKFKPVLKEVLLEY